MIARPPRAQQKKYYTSGQVAKILGISTRSVCLMFDDNILTGHRLPLGRDRRISHQALVDFMRRNKIPLGDLAEPEIKMSVLCLGVEPSLYRAISQHHPDWPVHVTRCPIAAGFDAAWFCPPAVLVDIEVIPLARAEQLASKLKESYGPVMISLAKSPDALPEAFDGSMPWPSDPALLSARIEALVLRRHAEARSV